MRPFLIFSKIRGDIRSLRCTTGIIATGTNDTSGIVGKFAAGVVDTVGNVIDTGGKFSADVVDTGTGDAPSLANISANFRKNSK